MKKEEKTLKLEKLFDQWVSINPEEYKGKFKKDGIICEDKFEKQKTKILFICKEGNKSKSEKSAKEGDYRSWWNEEALYGMFSIRIGSWAYGLLNGLEDIQNLSDQEIKEGLQSIAFMNLKKTAGEHISNFTAIKKCIQKDKDLIIKQINIIEPDIIIGGISWEPLWFELFDKIEEIKPNLFKSNNKLIVHFYHPSSRGKGISNKALYDNLRNLISSDIRR